MDILTQPSAADLLKRRDELIIRLDNGAALIEQERGKDSSNPKIALWEDRWIELLHEYEKICDTLAAQQSRERAEKIYGNVQDSGK